jgi:uncharacterized protein YyaL (SSP411 family)
MLQQYPQAHMSLVNSLEDFLAATQILIIRGNAAEVPRWAAELGARYAPNRMIFAIPRDADLPSPLALKRAAAGTVAYVCTGMTCSAPLEDLQAVARELERRSE